MSDLTRVNPWLAEVLEDYYAARQLWDDDRERVTKGHATEMAEYAEANPPPRLRDFLIDHAYTQERTA